MARDARTRAAEGSGRHAAASSRARAACAPAVGLELAGQSPAPIPPASRDDGAGVVRWLQALAAAETVDNGQGEAGETLRRLHACGVARLERDRAPEGAGHDHDDAERLGVLMSDRRCPRCDTVRPLAEFPAGARADGTHTYCRSCMRAYQRKRYSDNPEPERERCRSYNKANPHVPRQSMRRMRENDPAGALAKAREWRAANTEKVSAYDAKKRAIRRGAARGGRVTAAEWETIKERHQHRCAYCGCKPARLTMDHIIPLARGGQHEPSNIAPACSRCNSQKHAASPIDFAQRVLGRLL